MNIVFFGSSKFSLYFLEYLSLKRKDNLSVITTLDRPKGRGLKITENIIKDFCLKNNLKVYQFEDINNKIAKDFLKSLRADLFIVVAFGKIFSKEILEIPRVFALNVHASLLPQYRGAAPINWAIINGEKETGISIIKMEERLDAGPIILKDKIDIDINDDVLSLEEKLACLGRELLIKAIEMIEDNNFSLTPQNDREATFAPKLKKKDGLIDWSKSAISIYNLIRGCLVWPSAFTYYKNRLLKIHRAEYLPGSEGRESISPAGKILEISKDGILVACGRDRLLIREIQPEAKRKMTAGEFVCGYRVNVGDRLG